MASFLRTQSVTRCGSVAFFTLLLLTAWTAFGQPFTLNDVAFIGGLKTNTPPPIPWAPTNSIVWYKAPTGNNGNAVATLTDSSGNGNTAYEYSATAWHQPPYLTNNVVNGFPAIHFNQSVTNGLTNAVVLGSPCTVFAVINHQTSPVQTERCAVIDGATATARFMFSFSSASYVNFFFGTLSVDDALDEEIGWKVYTFAANGANSFVRTNGVRWFGGDAGTTGFSGQAIGVRYLMRAQEGFNGQIAELITYDGLVATNDMQWVESSLKSKYGL